MLRLGRALLTTLLLGVPRALGGRAFDDRVVLIEVAEADPSMEAFSEALARAVRRWAVRVSLTPSGPATAITVHRASLSAAGHEAISLSVGAGSRARRLVLHHRPEQREESALALLAALGGHGH